MNLQTLLQSLPPTLFPQSPDPSIPQLEISHITDDSRRVLPNSLFIARTGTKKSGADFAHEAIQKGALAILSEEKIPTPAHIPMIQVTNANLALPLLAHALAGHPTQNIKMLAVTGTKGKTTVAYLLRSILKSAGQKPAMIGTVEIDDGQTITPADMTTPSPTDLVDLFVKMRTNNVTHCIMEVSSHALHQHRVAGINFQIAIFTNLTGDHLDYHKTMDDYAAAKALLFESLLPEGFAILNANDPYARRMAQNCKAKMIHYGIKMDDQNNPSNTNGHSIHNPTTADTSAIPTYTATIQKMSPDAMQLQIHPSAGPAVSLTTLLIGKHNAYNLLAALAAASALNIPQPLTLQTLTQITGAPGRLQPVTLPHTPREKLPFQIFVDYAHTHDALENVLHALRQTMSSHSKLETVGGGGGNSKLICLFGCGGDRDRTKRPKMAAIAERLADQVIVTSDNPRTENPTAIIEEICTGFSPNWQSQNKITIEPDRRLAIQKAIALAHPGDVVLIAGKGHETYQILGTTKHHFDDTEEAQLALTIRTASVSESAGLPQNRTTIKHFPSHQPNRLTSNIPEPKGKP